jgi:hypothetical protein
VTGETVEAMRTWQKKLNLRVAGVFKKNGETIF